MSTSADDARTEPTRPGSAATYLDGVSEAGCGRTRIRKRWQGVPAECIYGPDGSLFAPKVGRRYVSTSYGAACS